MFKWSSRMRIKKIILSTAYVNIDKTYSRLSKYWLAFYLTLTLLQFLQLQNYKYCLFYYLALLKAEVSLQCTSQFWEEDFFCRLLRRGEKDIPFYCLCSEQTLLNVEIGRKCITLKMRVIYIYEFYLQNFLFIVSDILNIFCNLFPTF